MHISHSCSVAAPSRSARPEHYFRPRGSCGKTRPTAHGASRYVVSSRLRTPRTRRDSLTDAARASLPTACMISEPLLRLHYIKNILSFNLVLNSGLPYRSRKVTWSAHEGEKCKLHTLRKYVESVGSQKPFHFRFHSHFSVSTFWM